MLDQGQVSRRAAVENLTPVLAGGRPYVHQPVRTAHGVQVVFDHVHRIARLLEALQGFEQGFTVSGVQAGGRLVQYIDHAKELRIELRGQAQALQLARGQGRGTALERQVTQAELEQRVDAHQQLTGDALRGQAFFNGQVIVLGQVLGCCHLAQYLGQGLQGQLRQRCDVQTCKGDTQCLGLETFALTRGARTWAHVAGHALAHLRALRVHEGMQHIAPGARERALVAGLCLALEGSACLGRRKARVDRHGGCFFGVENPVTLLLGQVAPGYIHVIAQGDQNVPQVLPLPGHGPGSHCPFPDAQRGVGDHGRLGDLVDPAEPMARGAGALRRVGREILGIQHRLVGRVMACARVQHADGAR